MKTNYHTHSTWCDGKDSPRKMIQAAVERGFDVIGFSSHAQLPSGDEKGLLTAEKIVRYAAEIRALAAEYKDKIRVLCGVEADYVPGKADPDRATYAVVAPDYIIGSVHLVTAPDGGLVPVDYEPSLLTNGIRDHFGGSAEFFVQAYFAQLREMVAKFDFDVIGHLDLVRKFNVKHPYFDEKADWYLAELEKTAEAVAASGKIAEINTGAILRGWLNDAYPSVAFRGLLRTRGVKFVLSSDAHAAETFDGGFERFEKAEDFVELV